MKHLLLLLAFIVSVQLTYGQYRQEAIALTEDNEKAIPGKRYARQVQAKSGNPVVGNSPTDDNGVYQNNGLSEILYFYYVEDCLTPSFLTVKNIEHGKVEIHWNLNESSTNKKERR